MSILGDDVFFLLLMVESVLDFQQQKACINKLIKKRFQNHLKNVGSYFQDNLNKIIKNYDLDTFISCDGHPCRSIFYNKGF